MLVFDCRNCGNVAYFDNTVCVRCGSRLGYEPNSAAMLAFRPEGDRWVETTAPNAYQFCANAGHDACNWLVSAGEGGGFCVACRHNRTIPDLSRPADLDNWRRIEAAKRHLFYSLMRWRLPMPTRAEDAANGLAFDFLSDQEKGDGTVETVLTGHDNGIITINIAEGDDAERERRRFAMGEPYRTLLGHFRHEIGHYYWDRLVRDGGRLDACRALFGDERDDYAAALERHYRQGPGDFWQQSYISAYAAAHPWEDFAETWAHYLHIVDTLETAAAFGLTVRGADGAEASPIDDPYGSRDAETLISRWVPVTVAINAVNRSMGQPDLYPFVLSDPVVRKLQFVCDLVHGD